MAYSSRSLPDYSQLSMQDLSTNARRTLSLHLNLHAELPGESGHYGDYTGVAELRGFTPLHIQNFGRTSDPTDVMLSEWNSYGLGVNDRSVESLLDILKKVERPDVLDAITRALEASWANWQRNNAWQAGLISLPDQVNAVSSPSGGEFDSRAPTDHNVDEDAFICVEDEPGKKAFFDVFLSYTNSDLQHALLIAQQLESPKYNLKCFMFDRQLLGGASTYTADAKLIGKRCRKFVVLLSQEFVKSPVCDFQVRFAQCLSPGARSKKVIPILLEPGVRGPEILYPVAALDYSRADLRPWFWIRLYKTILAHSCPLPGEIEASGGEPSGPVDNSISGNPNFPSIFITLTKDSGGHIDISDPKASLLPVSVQN